MRVHFNMLSDTMPPEDHTAALTGIKTVESLIASFALTLPPEERMHMARVGVKAIDFSGKSYDYGIKNPELVPKYLDMNEFGNDITLTDQLGELINHMVPLVDKLIDTHAVVAAESYAQGRILYHHIKNAANANVPGAAAIAKELAKTFDIPKSTTKPKSQPVTNDTTSTTTSTTTTTTNNNNEDPPANE